MKTKYLIISGGIIILSLIGILISANANNTEIIKSEEIETNSQISEKNDTSNKSIIGTWIKESASQEDHDYPGDKDWELTVTFDDNGRFTWDSKRKGQVGNFINNSLSGTYTIENGFMVNYHFDKPSEQALEKIPELFAYWPNKKMGQQTFRFQNDKFILIYDGQKLRISMKKTH
ncbi:MAG: hypothetical protein JXA96_00385 [Sedimentisphaerales bacterium]|nr:hypothetical protein [Sedimentisphaerales bacterium]